MRGKNINFNDKKIKKSIFYKNKAINIMKKLLIQATIECGFTLKRVRDMTRTYSQ